MWCAGSPVELAGTSLKPINKSLYCKTDLYQQLAWVDNSPLLESATIEMYEHSALNSYLFTWANAY